MSYNQSDLIINKDSSGLRTIFLITQDVSKAIVIASEDHIPLGTLMDISSIDAEIFNGTVSITSKPREKKKDASSFRFVPPKGREKLWTTNIQKKQ